MILSCKTSCEAGKRADCGAKTQHWWNVSVSSKNVEVWHGSSGRTEQSENKKRFPWTWWSLWAPEILCVHGSPGCFDKGLSVGLWICIQVLKINHCRIRLQHKLNGCSAGKICRFILFKRVTAFFPSKHLMPTAPHYRLPTTPLLKTQIFIYILVI